MALLVNHCLGLVETVVELGSNPPILSPDLTPVSGVSVSRAYSARQPTALPPG